MRTVRPQDRKNQSRPIAPLEAMPADAAVVAMIQALIPLGLQAVEDALQQEVTRLADQTPDEAYFTTRIPLPLPAAA